MLVIIWWIWFYLPFLIYVSSWFLMISSSIPLLHTFWIYCFLIIWEYCIKFSFIIHVIFRCIFFQWRIEITTCILFTIMWWLSIMNRWCFQNAISLWIRSFNNHVVLYMFFRDKKFENIIANIINDTHCRVRYDNDRSEIFTPELQHKILKHLYYFQMWRLLINDNSI